MDKRKIEEKLKALYKTYGTADLPEVTTMDNPEKFLKKEGAIPLKEFIARINKLREVQREVLVKEMSELNRLLNNDDDK